MKIKNKLKKLPQRVHRAYLLREAENFREHKKGIPEWLKNADDSYTRHEEFDKVSFEHIPILLNFSKYIVSCLDFGGATGKNMVKHIPFYGSPHAATHGKKMIGKIVSGGHGNGGKYYALSQFKECKVISYYKGKLTVLLLNKEGDFVLKEDFETGPGEAIALIGLDKWPYFDKEGKELLFDIYNNKRNIFCWQGIEPKDKKNIQAIGKELSNLINAISNHPQSRSALRSREVHALLEGTLIWRDLKPEEVDIDESFGIREFSLPNDLGSYKFNKNKPSKLKIVLSKMPLTGDKSSLNILEIDYFGKSIAYYDLPTFMIDKGLSKSLFASIDCPELKEYNCVSNDRIHLFENDLTNLFLDWCRQKISEVIEELVNKEKQKAEKKDLDELGSFLKALMDEISQLLEEENLMKPSYDPKGGKIMGVQSPSQEEGFGSEGKIKNPGGGIRKGSEKKDNKSKDSKSKSNLQILLSNHDRDPLDSNGKTYDLIDRLPILVQRVEDIPYGIWWINTQKRYVKKMSITKNPRALPFYFFLIKEAILSHKIRRLSKDPEQFTPDGIDITNFEIIDNIFNKVADKLGLDLSFDQSVAEKIREAIRHKKKFSMMDLARELNVDPLQVNAILNNPSNGVTAAFKIVNGTIKGTKRHIKVYVRK